VTEYDLLVIGEINPDLILTGSDLMPAFGQAEKLIQGAKLTIGSSSVIMACGAARLGLRVSFIGLVGEDEFGKFMLKAMQQRDIDTSHCILDRERATGLSVIFTQADDRAILTHQGTMAALHIDHIDLDVLHRTRHLHVGSYFMLDALRPDLPQIYAQAKDLGITTSLDTNWDPTGSWNGGLDEMFPYVDVFMPNETEACAIAGRHALDQALDILSAQIPILAVKLGKEGGLARWAEGTVRAPALSVEAIDTTGAGDSFDAGVLYGYLHGWNMEKSLQLGCACGSLSTLARGGTDGQPTLRQALRALEYRDGQ
jgi:sugar/nucleoside kinase (ribokinase family)